MLIVKEAAELEAPRQAAATSGSGMSGSAPRLPGSDPAQGLARLIGPLRLAGCLGILIIVALSLVPAQWRPSTGFAKEIEHGIAYLLVAGVLTLGGLARWPRILVMAGLAAAMELGQILIPGRDCSLTDILASSAGALLGSGLGLFALSLVFRDSDWGAPDRPAVWSAPARLKALAAAVVLAVPVVALSIASVHGTPGWLGAGLGLAMLAIAVVDAKHFLIPDPLSAAGLALGLANAAILGKGDLIAALSGAALRATVLALLFLGLRELYARLRGRHGIGLGDVKLAAVAGTWLDWPVMPIAVEIAALSALAVYALRRYGLRDPLGPGSYMPFGLYFGPAIWIGWLLQTTLIPRW